MNGKYVLYVLKWTIKEAENVRSTRDIDDWLLYNVSRRRYDNVCVY